MEANLKKIANHYGFSNQLQMLVEEMSELTQAICKYRRYENAKEQVNTFENLIEEVADVQIVLSQIKILVGKNEVNKKIDEKVNRQLERMKKGE
jgi:NTP pyrophosphatase (non-canonical NTP hydrolase)